LFHQDVILVDSESDEVSENDEKYVMLQNLTQSNETDTSDIDDDIFLSDLLENNSVDATKTESYPTDRQSEEFIIELPTSASEVNIKNNALKQEKSLLDQPYHRGLKKYLPSDIWSKIEATTVDKLPYDINGTCLYMLQFDINNRMVSTKDGRPWGKYFVSTRKGFTGLRRLSSCKGSYKCLNENCSYLAEFQTHNRHHFRNDKCKHCKNSAFQVHCEARKIWEFEDSTSTVAVYHHGNHSCSIKPVSANDSFKQTTIDSFKRNPNLKPSQIPLCAVTRALDEGESWDKIDQLSESYADIQKIRNLKKKATNELNPYGQSLEAVAIFKEKTDEKDPFLIYKINDRKYNGKPSYIFKTSMLKLKIMQDMDRKSGKPLSSEYAFIDGFEKRCPGFTTIILSCYHPVLMKQVQLALMECEGESAENVSTFWQLIDECLTKLCGEETKFNPTGIMSDEAGSFWKAAKEHFPDDVIANSVSCEFHFKENVNRHSNAIKRDQDKLKFKKLANEWLSSITVNGYQAAMNILEDYCNTLAAKENLMKYIHWWDNRRVHWSRAYKGDIFTPTTNLAEVANASLVNSGSIHISLLYAAKQDVSGSILLQGLYNQYQKGVSAGSGPSQETKAKHARSKQKNAAARLCKEMDEFVGWNDYESDENCRHRPPSEKEVHKRGRPLKKRVSVYADSGSSESESENTKDRRPTRTRKIRSKNFEESLQRALHAGVSFKIVEVKQDNNEASFIVKSSKRLHVTKDNKVNYWSTYECSLASVPSCSCPYFTSSSKTSNCKHILWFLIKLCHIKPSDAVLLQTSYTTKELKSILKAIPKSIPSCHRYVANSDQDVHQNTSPSANEKNRTKINSTSSTTVKSGPLSKIFAKNQKSNKRQIWELTRTTKQRGKKPKCKTCGNDIEENQLHVVVEALYVPLGKDFAVKSLYRYCPDSACLQGPPPNRSNLDVCEKIVLQNNIVLNDFEYAICLQTELFS